MAKQITVLGQTFKTGDFIRVDYKIIEKEKVSGVKKREEKVEVKERIQPFEGQVLSISASKSFIVRRLGAGNIAIERIFPADSPWIKKISLVKKNNFKRSKLYNLRNAKSSLG